MDMTKQKQAKLSAGEMELMGLLWEHGPVSLSEAHEKIGRSIGYTTMQTRLNRLVEKKLASSEKTGRQPTRYSANVEPEQVGAGALDQLVEKVTRGRVLPLVAHLVENTELSEKELTELKQLVKAAEARLKTQGADDA
ncbi:MAG: BlaI/MecI/CopY family transcriptional regulator [Planctomycetota bacterium]